MGKSSIDNGQFRAYATYVWQGWPRLVHIVVLHPPEERVG